MRHNLFHLTLFACCKHKNMSTELSSLTFTGYGSRGGWGMGLLVECRDFSYLFFVIVWITDSVPSHRPTDRTFSTRGFSLCLCIGGVCLTMGEATEANKLILSGCLILNPPLICFWLWTLRSRCSAFLGLRLWIVILGFWGGSSRDVLIMTGTMSWGLVDEDSRSIFIVFMM